MIDALLKKRIKGLSLVEILVVLGLFSGIATFSLATLFNTQVINTRLLQSQAILDNVNLSLQTITREIRYGSNFYCATALEEPTPVLRKNCPKGGTGGTFLYFEPADAVNEKDRTVYFVSSGVLYKREILFSGASTTYQMTSQDIYITQFKIFVNGANTSTGVKDAGNAIDYTQPLVSFFISGKAKASNSTETSVPFNIQTHISPRILDNS